jgi:hypothetical protein
LPFKCNLQRYVAAMVRAIPHFSGLTPDIVNGGALHVEFI